MKKQLKMFTWFMGLMGKRLPLYIAAIVISSIGMAFAKIANARIVEDIVTAAQTRETQGLLWSVGIAFGIFILGWV